MADNNPKPVPMPTPNKPVTPTPPKPAAPAKPVEQVLVFPAQLLDKLGKFRGALTDARVGKYLDEILDTKNLSYMDRDKAEKDPSFKQVIPYTVLIMGREVFRYQRTKKGGESRLHDKWSVGVGGHINPKDGPGDKETYEAAFYRELMEEVSIGKGPLAPIMGLLYDESDEVGKVHFGIVHFLKLQVGTHMAFKDPSLSNGQWQHIIETKQSTDNFENWSRLVIDKILQ